MEAIFKMFNDQEIACKTPVVQDSDPAVATPNIAPVVTATPGDTKATLTWASVQDAASYQIFCTHGAMGCNQGKVLLGEVTSSLSFTDTGLQNGLQ